MNDLAQALAQHQPLICYGTELFDDHDFECSYCTPRQLIVLPIRGWERFAEHLARVITEAGATS